MSNPKRIVLLDDDETLRSVLSAELQKEGYDAIALASKADGCDWIAEHIPDLIISDIRSPGMDGFQFLEWIRANPRTAHIPFVFLTGNASLEVAIRTCKMGANDFISKPYDLEDLLVTIERVLREQPPFTSTPEHTEEMQSRHRPLIVVLDDEKTLIQIFSEVFGKEGIDVKGFCYKDEFLRQLPFLRPDVIITDIAAPRMDGLEFLEKIKADKEFCSIPVIVMSGNIPRLKAEAMQRGAVACFPKGVDFPALKKLIQSYISYSQNPGK